jgi:hypothetical protein
MARWCCLGFENHYNQAGRRGAGVLIGRDSTGRPEFTLQYRAADKDDNPVINSEKPISLIVETGICFCPWCGRDLTGWYGDEVKDLYKPDLRVSY